MQQIAPEDERLAAALQHVEAVAQGVAGGSLRTNAEAKRGVAKEGIHGRRRRRLHLRKGLDEVHPQGAAPWHAGQRLFRSPAHSARFAAWHWGTSAGRRPSAAETSGPLSLSSERRNKGPGARCQSKV